MLGMNNNQPSDVTRMSLLSRAAEQDSRAWEQIVDLYGPLIAYWCRHSGLDTHRAADCVQEVFAALARSLPTFRPQNKSGAFRAWLWTITSNKIKDLHRHDRRHPSPTGGSTAALAIGQIVDPLLDQEPSDDQQLSELMARALEQIRPEFEPRSWEIFHRAALDKIDTATVASEFDTTPAAIRQTRSRIMRRLRQQLGDVGDE
ncbi:MAG: sigma-70 family RNA polymerase sigma factor [Aureliella sp.]